MVSFESWGSTYNGACSLSLSKDHPERPVGTIICYTQTLRTQNIHSRAQAVAGVISSVGYFPDGDSASPLLPAGVEKIALLLITLSHH